MRVIALTLLLLLLSVPLFAQSTLTSVAFVASPDQNATMVDGTAVLTNYELVIDELATTNPPAPAVIAWVTIPLGKPTPAPVTNLITLTNVAIPLPITGGEYTGRLAAIGPGGRSADLIGPFSQPTLPRVPSALRIVR